jgi:hypothetical protein
MGSNNAMSDDLYKCVITPNVRTIKMESLDVKLGEGIHVIEDQTKTPFRRTVVVPAGTLIIQSYSIDKDGKETINETQIVLPATPAP